MEARAIGKFSDALLSANYDQLVANSSKEFESKALRQKQAVKDFKLVKFPKGKTSIDEVKEISKTEKLVIVSVAGSKKKLNYNLIKDSKTDKWVVNDVLIHKRKDGEAVTDSVMEQMDLILSVREFVSAWSMGQKQDVLNVLTPKLGKQMEPLSQESISYLAHRAMGKSSKRFKADPEAEIDGKKAIVRLERQAGEIVLTYQKMNNKWKVNDISLTSEETKQVESFDLLVKVMNNSTHFLQAFKEEDRKQLAALSTEKFYRGSLAPAQLSIIKVPSLQNKENKIDIKLQGNQADFIIEGKTEIFKIRLARSEAELREGRLPEPKVEDVTIYDLKNNSEKKLSALFTAHAIVDLFADAIATGNIDMLKNSSTVEFNKKVWDNLTDRALLMFPLHELDSGKLKIMKTEYEGALSRVHVQQGSQRLIYLLRDNEGELRVDDILMPVTGRPKSFKTTMELLQPVRQFAATISAKRLDLIQRTSSKDFNRLIWHQMKGIPVMAMIVPNYLNKPIHSIRIRDEASEVVLGDNVMGAKVSLVNEYGKYVVDNVELISGTEPHQRAMLKQTMVKKFGEGALVMAENNIQRQQPESRAIPHLTSQRSTKNMSESELLQHLQRGHNSVVQQQRTRPALPSQVQPAVYQQSTQRPLPAYGSPQNDNSKLRGGEIMFTPKGKTIHKKYSDSQPNGRTLPITN